MVCISSLGLLALSVLVLRYVVLPLLNSLKLIFGTPMDVTRLGGDWALVTGATDGIGKAFAFELASRGLNIVLVSRSQSKLDEVKAAITTQHPKIEVKTVAVDFANEDVKSYTPRLRTAVDDLDISVLVNNVGMSYSFPANILDLDVDPQAILDVNATSLLAMTQIALPGMVRRKKGAIINISSFSGVSPSPMLAVYGAAKAFVSKLSTDLRTEYCTQGITIMCLTPGYVQSKMSNIRRSSLSVPTPELYVKSAMKRLGVVDDSAGYWVHDVMLGVLQALPTPIATKIVYSQLADVRKRALRKREKQQ